MVGAAYSSIEDIEIVWTVLAAFGTAFSASNLWAARNDLAWVKANDIGNGRKVLAINLFRGEVARLIKQILFLVVGVLAMTITTPNYVDLTRKDALINAVIRWTFIYAAAATTYQSYLAWITRRNVEREDGR